MFIVFIYFCIHLDAINVTFEVIRVGFKSGSCLELFLFMGYKAVVF